MLSPPHGRHGGRPGRDETCAARFLIVCLLCASPAYAQGVGADYLVPALALILLLGLVGLVIRQASRPGALDGLAVAIVSRLNKGKAPSRSVLDWKIAGQARDRADQ